MYNVYCVQSAFCIDYLCVCSIGLNWLDLPGMISVLSVYEAQADFLAHLGSYEQIQIWGQIRSYSANSSKKSSMHVCVLKFAPNFGCAHPRRAFGQTSVVDWTFKDHLPDV